MVFTDNFGEIIAHLFQPPSAVQSASFNVEGVLATRLIVIYATTGNAGRYNFDAQPTKTQVGKGTTPATRQDIKIETPFPDPPEDTFFANNLAGYNSGLGKITAPASVSPTGGAGAISEMVIVNTVRATNTNIFNCVMTRDNVSPLVNFIVGKTINTALEVLI